MKQQRLIDAYQAQNIFIEFFHIRKPQQLAAQRQAFALVPTVDAIPIDYMRSQVDSGKWEEIITRWKEHDQIL